MPAPSRPGSLVAGLLLLAFAAWGVLRAGESLTAPPPLAPAWELVGRAPCAVEATRLTLSQSGVFLDVRWPGGPATALKGRLDGDRVVLSGPATACGSDEVRLEGTWTPAGLEGRLTTPGCTSCDGVTIAARGVAR